MTVLYSFRRCPYAMRARSAMIASGIHFELREVVLRNKPAAMLAASPKATVPVLLLPDGRVVDESWDIMLWALRCNDPQSWLGENEQMIASALPLLHENDTHFKCNLDQYKYPERYPEQPQSSYRSAGEPFLQQLEQRLSHSRYLLGDSFSIADAALLPFIRQFAAVDKNWFARSPYPTLRAWLEQYTSSQLFADVMQKFPAWQADTET